MAVAKLKDLKHIPGSSGLPYFGDLFPYLKDATGYYSRMQQQYGDIFRSTTPFATAVTMVGPTANKFILVEQSQFFSNREAWEVALKELFPNGLMLMDGAKHRYHRSIMNEAFKKGPMQGYLEIMPEVIDSELNKLNGLTRVQFFPFIKEATLTLASKVFLGIEDEGEIPAINKHISNLVNAALTLPIPLPFTKYSKGKASRKALVKYFKKLITLRRSDPGDDLLSRFCTATNENGDRFNDREIIDHLIFVLMAAHDTTASTLTTMAYYLAKYPKWQSRVLEEGIRLSHIDQPVVKDLREMADTSHVMKEAFRLHPPLISVARKAEKDYQIEGHFIPKNTIIQLVMQMTHIDERNWTNPDLFDPERFNQQRKEHMKCPFSYAPFGAGPHHCIGYAFAEVQIKLIMANLLRRFKLSVPETYNYQAVDVPLKHPKDGLWLNLELRNI